MVSRWTYVGVKRPRQTPVPRPGPRYAPVCHGPTEGQGLRGACWCGGPLRCCFEAPSNRTSAVERRRGEQPVVVAVATAGVPPTAYCRGFWQPKCRFAQNTTGFSATYANPPPYLHRINTTNGTAADTSRVPNAKNRTQIPNGSIDPEMPLHPHNQHMDDDPTSSGRNHLHQPLMMQYAWLLQIHGVFLKPMLHKLKKCKRHDSKNTGPHFSIPCHQKYWNCCSALFWGLNASAKEPFSKRHLLCTSLDSPPLPAHANLPGRPLTPKPNKLPSPGSPLALCF